MPCFHLKTSLVFFRTGLVFISFLTIQSCSNSPIGEKLASRFDLPQKELILENGEKKEPENISKKKDKLVKAKLVKDKDLDDIINIKEESIVADEIDEVVIEREEKITKDVKKSTTVKPKSSSTQEVNLDLVNSTFTPSPYRITIKLSGANPSAPAEIVTKALRSAGISFEVERIERVPGNSLIKVSPPKGLRP